MTQPAAGRPAEAVGGNGPPEVDVDRVATVVLSVPGVTGLHGGTFGVGTYLPGRRVLGIRLGDDDRGAEIHVTVAMGSNIPAVAAAIVSNVEPLLRTTVLVFVEDVTQKGNNP